MGKGTPAVETVGSGDICFGNSSDTFPRERSTQKGGKTLEVGKALIKTIHHYWPDLSQWISQLPDTRFAPFIEYEKQFLLWHGFLLFIFELGSRRQIDYQLRDDETYILDNINRLASTKQKALPVNGTLNHFLGHVGWEAIAWLRTQFVRRLIRMKAIDDYRLKGMLVCAVDGTEYLAFHYRHCDHCIKRSHNGTIVYHHPVLEAKIVTVSGLALSIASEFIQNSDIPGGTYAIVNYDDVKQDCELKAFTRLALVLKKDYPQTPLCISGDALFCCGSAIQICKNNHWSFVFVLKQGRSKTLWEDFVGLLTLEKNNYRNVVLPQKTQHFQWVNNMSYKDTEERLHTVNAIICKEIDDGGTTTTFAWATDINVTYNSVTEIAAKGGRSKWNIENQGFNDQKNSGLNMEHPYSTGATTLKSFYLLLQIAHMIQQLLEKGSLLKNIVLQYGKKSVVELFGSSKNIPAKLLECFRNFLIPDEVFEINAAAGFQIRLDSS
jgi:hypothetical protein